MYVKLGELSTVVASSSEAAKAIMKTNDIHFAYRPHNPGVDIFSYGRKSLASAPYGQYRRQLKKICISEFFSAKRLVSFHCTREEEVRNLIRSISSSKTSVVNLSEMLTSMASSIVTRVVIGKECDIQTEFLEMLRQIQDSASGFGFTGMFPRWWWLLGFVSGCKFRLENLHHKMDRILDSILAYHKEKKNTAVLIEGVDEDLVDVLLRFQAEGGSQFELPTDSIKAVILEMFTAGTETTSATLQWAMSELMRNPQVLKRAQLEVREAFKGKTKVVESDISELNYLQLVIKETMRLHPPLPLLLPRECQKACEVLGYKLPEKTNVFVNVWAIGRDPECWEDAEEFKPQRFQGSTQLDFKGTNFEFLPFGAGRRMCPGMLFGLPTIELCLAQLLHHFDWELPDPKELPGGLDMGERLGVAGSVCRRSDLRLRAISYSTESLAV